MIHDRLTVRQASQADLDALAPAYIEATMDEAVSRWVLPDEDRRRALAQAGFRSFLATMLDRAEIVVAEIGTDQIAGVSIWLPGDQPVFDGSEQPAEIREAYGEYADRPGTVIRLTGERHPDQPHLYLFSIAVVPAHRSSGVGGAILRHRLERADAEAVPAYLEASTPRNRKLYERHGFGPLGDPIRLPDDGPTLQPMWREPRPASVD